MPLVEPTCIYPELPYSRGAFGVSRTSTSETIPFLEIEAGMQEELMKFWLHFSRRSFLIALLLAVIFRFTTPVWVAFFVLYLGSAAGFLGMYHAWRYGREYRFFDANVSGLCVLISLLLALVTATAGVFG